MSTIELRHGSCGEYSAPSSTSRFTASEINPWRSLRRAVSEKTVASHLSHIFTKLGLSSRSAATTHAFEHGLTKAIRR